VFRTTTVQVDSCTHVLRVQGDIDLSNVQELEEAFQALFDTGIYRIVVDLERVTFIASAGFGCLLGARNVVLKHDGDLVFAGARSQVREIFDMLGITSILQFAPDVGGALAHLESRAPARR
jgi:anti-sigma B factor antagonist